MNTTKINLVIFLFSLLTLPNYAQVDIPMSPTNSNPEAGGSRSIISLPTATLDGMELTLSYPLVTESQVVIEDQNTNVTVYSSTFTPTCSIVIDLAEEGLTEGTYTLHVYAYGKWWIGVFVLENE